MGLFSRRVGATSINGLKLRLARFLGSPIKLEKVLEKFDRNCGWTDFSHDDDDFAACVPSLEIA